MSLESLEGAIVKVYRFLRLEISLDLDFLLLCSPALALATASLQHGDASLSNLVSAASSVAGLSRVREAVSWIMSADEVVERAAFYNFISGHSARLPLPDASLGLE